MAISAVQEKPDAYLSREFPMSDKNFALIKKRAYELTGINLTDHKKNMIYGRLARRLRALKLKTFDQYCDVIAAADSSELNDFINSITTNLTSFFRESHHFDFLEKTVFPELLKKNAQKKRIRIWSAGCSTGEEPYSLSILMNETLPVSTWDIKLLATDLDSNVLDCGKQGVYEMDRVESISDSRKKRWFLRDRATDQVSVKPVLKEIISFKQLNLLQSWPMKGPFDIIFCRNVVIYFDKDTQRKLFKRYASLMSPKGYLFIGHSESLNNVSNEFESLGHTIYQKIN